MEVSQEVVTDPLQEHKELNQPITADFPVLLLLQRRKSQFFYDSTT